MKNIKIRKIKIYAKTNCYTVLLGTVGLLVIVLFTMSWTEANQRLPQAFFYNLGYPLSTETVFYDTKMTGYITNINKIKRNKKRSVPQQGTLMDNINQSIYIFSTK